jgi:hypothetical protein
MPTPLPSQFVAQAVKVSSGGATRHYLTVFMAFSRGGGSCVLTPVGSTADGTPAFNLIYRCGAGAQAWSSWTGSWDIPAPVNGRIVINGNPITIEEPADGLINCK